VSDADDRTDVPTPTPAPRVARWLRLLKLLLGVVVAALTVLHLLGVL
jgi:hypothetical protein